MRKIDASYLRSDVAAASIQRWWERCTYRATNVGGPTFVDAKIVDRVNIVISRKSKAPLSAARCLNLLTGVVQVEHKL